MASGARSRRTSWAAARSRAGRQAGDVLRVEYFDGKHSVGFDEFAARRAVSRIVFGRLGEPGGSTMYVRTEHSAGWMKVSQRHQLITDAQKLVAAP